MHRIIVVEFVVALVVGVHGTKVCGFQGFLRGGLLLDMSRPVLKVFLEVSWNPRYTTYCRTLQLTLSRM